MKSLTSVVVLALVGAPVLSAACLNDVESRKWQLQPRAHERIIAGDFVREPDIYYQFRVRRLEAKRKKEGLALHEFDDLAVAYDRLGEHLKAIAVMQSRAIQAKKPLTERDLAIPFFDDGLELSAEHYLRYSALANYGTFEIHQWVKEGRPVNTSRVTKGLAMLEEAVKVNPDAHSGREWVQIDLTKWMLRLTKNPAEPYPVFKRPATESITGLVGLIELGTAWQSLDVYRMIQNLAATSSPQVAIFARERARELESAGSKSQTRALWTPPKSRNSHSIYEVSSYRKLRGWSDENQAAREAHMRTKLSTAKDEEELAAGFKPKPKPELTFGVEKPWYRRTDFQVYSVATMMILGTISLYIIGKRRLARRATK